MNHGMLARVSVIAVQELQRDRDGISDLTHTLLRLGWQLAGAPSVLTPEGGLSAGCGILVRAPRGFARLDLFPFDVSPKLSPGRLTVAWADVIQLGGVLAASGYPWHS